MDETMNDTKNAPTQPRGVFIKCSDDGHHIEGLQLIGGTTRLEAYALLSIMFERLQKDLKL